MTVTGNTVTNAEISKNTGGVSIRINVPLEPDAKLTLQGQYLRPNRPLSPRIRRPGGRLLRRKMRVPRREHAHVPVKGGAGCPPWSALTHYRRLVWNARSRNPNGGSFAQQSTAVQQTQVYPLGMCRNIRTLHNFEPPTTSDEVRASALQYVRKISGFTKPSQANAQAFERAVDDVAGVSMRLLDELVTSAPPKHREEEAAKARSRSARRYAA